MTINPYNPPSTAFTPNESECPFIPFGWKLCFWILVASIAIDLGITVSRLNAVSQGVILSSMAVLALIALTQTLMVFSIRWILFRLILRHHPPGEIGGVMPLVGVIVIFTMVKLIEFQGFRLWFGSGDLAKFLVFLIPSLALMVFMSPRRLSQFQSRGRHVRVDPMNGVAIRP